MLEALVLPVRYGPVIEQRCKYLVQGIHQVIEPADGSDETCDLSEAAFVSYGKLVNSGEYDGKKNSSIWPLCSRTHFFTGLL